MRYILTRRPQRAVLSVESIAVKDAVGQTTPNIVYGAHAPSAEGSADELVLRMLQEGNIPCSCNVETVPDVKIRVSVVEFRVERVYVSQTIVAFIPIRERR